MVATQASETAAMVVDTEKLNWFVFNKQPPRICQIYRKFIVLHTDWTEYEPGRFHNCSTLSNAGTGKVMPSQHS